MTDNFFRNVPRTATDKTEEIFETLLETPGVRIERILSHGQASPPDFWYCQAQDEWVIVLQGAAGVRLENEPDIRILQVGDFINIPAQCRHRVEWTDVNGPTLWLAVHYGDLSTEQ